MKTIRQDKYFRVKDYKSLQIFDGSVKLIVKEVSSDKRKRKRYLLLDSKQRYRKWRWRWIPELDMRGKIICRTLTLYCTACNFSQSENLVHHYCPCVLPLNGNRNYTDVSFTFSK